MSASAAASSAAQSANAPLLSRVIDVIVPARETPEGLGARVRRSVGGPFLRNFDPFLLLDHASIDVNAGFPDHPHRGFETVSYNLPSSKGTFIHEDFTGKRGDLKPGDVQWMTAGRGIMHSEVPLGDGTGEGIQLWVNLSKKDKMIKPEYQDLRAADIPSVTHNGVLARIIAGEAFGVSARTRTRTPTYYIHFELPKGGALQQKIPKGWNSLLYVVKGTIVVANEKEEENENNRVDTWQTATLKQPKGAKEAEGVTIRTASNCSKEGASVLFLAGQPLNEPVVQYGPFVMNSQEEIQKAFLDFQTGRNGFEKAVGWKSDIGQKFRSDHQQKKKIYKKKHDDEDDLEDD